MTVQFGYRIMQNQNPNVKHPFATDPKFSFLFGNENNGLFNQQPTPIPEIKNTQDAWEEIENKARMDPALTCSPFPEADVELHKLFKLDDSEYVLQCMKIIFF